MVPKGAEQNFSFTEYNLAFMLYTGNGIKKDLVQAFGWFKKAVQYYEKACAADYGEGCFHLGMLHFAGKVFSKDVRKAEELYRKACNLKSSIACTNLKLNF